MKKITLLFIVFLFAAASIGYAQGTVTGTVYDASSNGPLPGANILQVRSDNGTSTDFDGKFSIKTTSNTGTINISYIGFGSKNIAFDVTNGNQDLGIISLALDNSLEEIVVVGTGVIDLVRERETPVASSTLAASDIQKIVGNQEFPEILRSTPSVYATKNGGGYGDSRVNIRGFDQTNLAVIINGQPVNDMENGAVFWSNWQGLADIASGVQIQRGLGASKLAVPSVGGTINVVTKSTDRAEGGFFNTVIGNDSYIKTVVGYDTGINEKGWASSFLFGRWGGDGYVDATKGEGYTYLLSVGYIPSDNHAFNFTFTGAGQSHDQRRSWVSIRDYENFGGSDKRKFNLDWGLRNGNEYNFRKNFYNKPIATLNWDWTINEKLSLSTSIYGSWGRGGGTGSRGRNFDIFPFNEDLTESIDGLDYRTESGIIDVDGVVANNQSGTPYTGNGPYEGLVLGSNRYNEDGVNSNVAIRRASMNSHDWYGGISNLKYELEKFTFGVGLDLRTYTGYHYRVVNDLLGLDGYYSTGNQNLNTGLIITETIKADPFQNTGLKGNKIDFYNIGKVQWTGLNGLIEYKEADSFTAVVQMGISNQGYQRIDYFDQILNVESDKENMIGGFIKGGANYNINDVHNVFFNAGYIERQPKFDAVFPNFGNDITDDLQNEKILSYEVGYGFNTNYLDINLNLYRTSWKDRFESGNVQLEGGASGTVNYQGVEQLHQGVELEVVARPLQNLRINGMVSIGDWRYTDDITADVFDDNQQNIGTSTLYLNDVKVGDAAQFTTSLNVSYEVIDGLDISGTWRNSSNIYGDFGVQDSGFENPDNEGAIELPAFDVFDAGIGYKFKFSNKLLKFRVNVNNLFDTEYIAESNTNISVNDLVDPTDPAAGTYLSTGRVYDGIADGNSVWFGFGRTWNASLRFEF